MREHDPLRVTESGAYGPVYAILAIDGEELPEPKLLSSRSQFYDYREASAQWQRFYSSSIDS